jgi:transcriptional regulator with XRE-family HTH domain
MDPYVRGVIIMLRLRALRKQAGLSQAALARRAKVRQATVSKYERSALRSVDLGVLERLARALGVSPLSLLVLARPTARRQR